MKRMGIRANRGYLVIAVILILIVVGILGTIIAGFTFDWWKADSASEQNPSELNCKSKIDCESVVSLRVPYHSCSVNNGCEIREEKCISSCEDKDMADCTSPCEWR